MEKLTGIIDGAKSGWKKIDTKKRNIFVSVFAIVIILSLVFNYYLNKVNYTLLFSNLELEDAGIIINDLEAKKIKFKLSNNGRDIHIDEKHVDKYRLELAMDGNLPENSTGFEIFDNMGLMATDEDRKIMYQRALTGELQRSIMSLDAVNSAKVHLMIPTKTIFESEQKEASASVIIDIKPGQRITNEMINGIAALVSGAVDNLPKENVQIIDSKGNLLSGILVENENYTSLDVLDRYQSIREDFERKLEANLYNLLGSAFGQDKIKISVYAELDFDAEETTTIVYDNPVIRSESVRTTGANVNIQDSAGLIDDNISNVTGSSGNDNSTYERTVENELSSETKTVIKAPGKVNKLTTSVVYDGNLTEANRSKIQNIVATATGYDSERGDLISVEGISFDRSYLQGIEKELEQIKEEEEQRRTIFDRYGVYIINGLRVLGVLVLLFLIRATFFRKKTKEKVTPATEMVASQNISVYDIFDGTEDTLNVKSDSKQAMAERYAKENPEIAADLIKAWIKD